VNRKRVRRLMRVMGLEAIYPQLSRVSPGATHRRRSAAKLVNCALDPCRFLKNTPPMPTSAAPCLRWTELRAAANGARLPDAVGSVLGGERCAASVPKTFRREKFWPAARLSRIVNLDPIRVRSSTAAPDLGEVWRSVKAHLN
jgi:hypothetical protein